MPIEPSQLQSRYLAIDCRCLTICMYLLKSTESVAKNASETQLSGCRSVDKCMGLWEPINLWRKVNSGRGATFITVTVRNWVM